MGSISESFIKRTRGSHSANQEVPAAVFSLIYNEAIQNYTILSTNVRQRTLKSLAIMSPLGTMFVQEGAERRVSWR